MSEEDPNLIKSFNNINCEISKQNVNMQKSSFLSHCHVNRSKPKRKKQESQAIVGMIVIVTPQPSMGGNSAAPPVNELPPFTMSQDSSLNRLALVTPSLAPREAVSPSPPPLQIPKPDALPLAIASEAFGFVPGLQPFLAYEEKPKTATATTISPPSSPKECRASTTGVRLNKFVRRLHDMLQSEQKSGIVEWRRGLLVLHSTDAFAKTFLPQYFNTRNFKTFRRQLNYYGFVHVRSFSTTGSTTTALWVNRDLAQHGTADISSVLMLKRVEPCESAKTAEGRRVRKELAVSTVEEDIGVSAKSLQLEQIRSMALRRDEDGEFSYSSNITAQIPLVVHCHGTNSTATTTLEGGFMPTNDGSCISITSNSAESSDTESDNKSAANLLLMLSKSTNSFK